MMFKIQKNWIAVFLLGLLLMLFTDSSRVLAEEKQSLPTGDILLMYSDKISEEDMDRVMELVENLTFQNFQVTYASASECSGELYRFSHIICYKVEYFPAAVLTELEEKKKTELLFIGNSFLRSYLKEAGREAEYMDSQKQVGNLQYSFSEADQKEALVREEDFLFLTGNLDYRSGNLSVGEIDGYFCAAKGTLSHIAVTDVTDPLVEAAAVKEVSSWKWDRKGEAPVYAQYIVINEVYPFQNPDKLLEIVKYLKEEKQPFIISVMPVYSNGTYPAMQHFCEVLRYAQAGGGAVILHTPLNQMPEFDEELVGESITTAIDIYAAQGVYPMGIQAPSNWMFHSSAASVLDQFQTVMIADETDQLIERDSRINTNKSLAENHQWIAPAITLDATGTSHLTAYSAAVYLDMADSMEEIEEKVQACMTSEVPLRSLADSAQGVNDFTPTEYEENYQYNRNKLQRFSRDLSSGNNKLTFAVIVVALLFLVFLLIARYRNKRYFITGQSGRRKNRKKRQDNGKTDR